MPPRGLLISWATPAASLKDLIERIVYMTSDEEIAVHARRGPG